MRLAAAIGVLVAIAAGSGCGAGHRITPDQVKRGLAAEHIGIDRTVVSHGIVGLIKSDSAGGPLLQVLVFPSVRDAKRRYPEMQRMLPNNLPGGGPLLVRRENVVLLVLPSVSRRLRHGAVQALHRL